MCWCSDDAVAVDKYVSLSASAIEQLSATLKSQTASKAQTELDLSTAKSDREGAQGDIEEATVLRNKENAAYAATKADMETNIAAMGKAIPALESGMGGAALLQMPGGDRLKKIVESYPNVDPQDRRNTIAFF